MMKHPALEFDARRVEALVANDIAAVGKLFDDELIYVHSIGLVQRKREVLGMFAHALHVRALETSIDSVVEAGELALLSMTQHMRFHLAADPQHELEARTWVTAAWRRNDDGWRLLRFQATALAAPGADR